MSEVLTNLVGFFPFAILSINSAFLLKEVIQQNAPFLCAFNFLVRPKLL